MTLRKRNTLLILSIILTFLSFITIAVLFTTAYLKGQITPPENALRPFPFLSRISHPFFQENFTAVIISVFIFSFYVPLMLLIIYRLFEKTQAMEIIFFAEFLLGCFLEQIRIFMPFSGLWQTYTFFLNVIGSVVLAGRMLAPLCLFFITVFTDQNQRQDFTHNIFIALLLSVFTGVLMPLDPSNTTSTCTVVWSFSGLFLTIRAVLFISTIICFFYKARIKNSK